MEINLLWLMLPSMGLATYVQYAHKNYDDKIEKIEEKVNEAKVKIAEQEGCPIASIGEVLNLPDVYQKNYEEIERRRVSDARIATDEDIRKKYDLTDEAANTTRNLIIFIGAIVFFQYFSLVLPSALFIIIGFFTLKQLVLTFFVAVFLFVLSKSIIRVFQKNKRCMNTFALLHSYLNTHIEQNKRLKKIVGKDG